MFLTDGNGRVLTDEFGNPLWDNDPPINIISLDPFWEEIRWHLPELPVALVTSRLITVIREFCRKTWVVYRGFRVLSEHLDPVENLAVLAHIDEYMPGLIPLAVAEVKLNGVVTEAKPRIMLNTDDAGLYYSITDATIRLFPFGTLPEISLMVAFAPSGDATEYPGELRPYIKGIASGFLAEIYAMPNKPWTDLALSAYHAALYGQAIGQAQGNWCVYHGTSGKVRWI